MLKRLYFWISRLSMSTISRSLRGGSRFESRSQHYIAQGCLVPIPSSAKWIRVEVGGGSLTKLGQIANSVGIKRMLNIEQQCMNWILNTKLCILRQWHQYMKVEYLFNCTFPSRKSKYVATRKLDMWLGIRHCLPTERIQTHAVFLSHEILCGIFCRSERIC